MAAVEKLKAEKGDAAVDEATCAMGLSLGEYSALCFAGALSFEDGVKVTKARYVHIYVHTYRKGASHGTAHPLDRRSKLDLVRAKAAANSELRVFSDSYLLIHEIFPH